ncbi:hypothetical protein BJX96DRAFT_44084 [Aspergillus floccosus]
MLIVTLVVGLFSTGIRLGDHCITAVSLCTGLVSRKGSFPSEARPLHKYRYIFARCPVVDITLCHLESSCETCPLSKGLWPL